MKKDLVAIAVVVFILVILLSGTKIQSVDDYYLTHIDEITDDSETIYISIDCKTVLDNWDKLDESLQNEKYIPAEGIVLEKSQYVLRPDDNAFDVLDRAIRHNEIQMEAVYSKGFGSNYVKGINHLYEFSCGELSGWMYKVNGEFPSYGASKYELQDGDYVEWVYSCDLGRDVGSEWGAQTA